MTDFAARMAAGTHVCANCGTRAVPTRHIAGSGLVTLFLLFLAIIPGIIYESWRRNASYEACPRCGAKNMLPVETPAAQAILTRQAN